MILTMHYKTTFANDAIYCDTMKHVLVAIITHLCSFKMITGSSKLTQVFDSLHYILSDPCVQFMQNTTIL